MSQKVSLVPTGIVTPVVQASPPIISVCSNNDQVIVAWKYAEPIKDCIGFAVYRKLNNESDTEADALMNRVGFADEAFKKGEQRPSYEWPIQRFIWTDFSVSEGDTASYKIVPILYDGDQLSKDMLNASAWSAVAQMKTGIDAAGNPSPYHVYFNRGIISSQFFSRMKENLSSELPGTTIKAIIGGANNKLRDFLGGFLDNRLFSLLDDVIGNPDLTIYSALYELHQSDLLDKLKKIGSRAHVILANGAAKKKGEDKNEDSRKEIRDAGVDVYDRIVDVTQKHFAHNKFVVICHKGDPIQIWSGSTNWTPGGLFSQVNNGIFIEDPALAKVYKAEWDALKYDVVTDDSGYGTALYDKNKAAHSFGSANSRVWFAPTPAFDDLKDVESLMEAATTGILFLMFNPGPKNTFFNYIIDLQTRKPDLFIHGVINQDPGATGKIPAPLIFFHQGQQTETDWNAIMPETISEEFSFWYKEVSAGMVTIHSKILVIDPFGPNPYVVTGSHNFGPKASSTNDENLLIINDKKVAEQYAVNIMAVYDHYRWRYSLFKKNTDFKGLSKDREWMADYMENKLRAKELDFWL
ncbi:phospholipase D-like protein [Mucilaginibacter gracilis]|uniref:phospholipase D n=1 Tax=Mucilaginibacter gracilis TaxID=423350 RepID=A0A495J337_9SPHI|nr:phospholipase D-like domain-containing protein [Mucilaginibacter gracilis]RKR83396.1 phospholipase D-like protein [Mucilaginibacter gracilis]